MRLIRLSIAPLAALGLAACMTPIGPVEVTRFHQPAAVETLGHGTISVEAAAGEDPASLELQSYQRAVAGELISLGYSEVAEGEGAQIALVRIERTAFQPGRDGSPVSVGVSGSTGSYGSGVGLGIGVDLSGPPPEQVTTELGVMIRDRASGETLWEGRANFTVRTSSPLAQTQLGAPKMAEALFLDFPGNNGETVRIP
jgi:hypothetical protein